MKEPKYPSLPERIRYDINRFKSDIIPAFKERFATDRVPPKTERLLTPEEGGIFLDSLISRELSAQIFEMASELDDGEYVFQEEVGHPGEATRHVHSFFVEKDDSGVRLFFVDPEHLMGKSKNWKNFSKYGKLLPITRGHLRPKANILYTVEMSPDGRINQISLMRYRSDAIKDPSRQRPRPQLELARQMVKIGGIPQELKGQENEITFWLEVKEILGNYQITMQAREAGQPKDLDKIINTLKSGESLPAGSPIAGQISRFKKIARTHFPKLLKDKSFKPDTPRFSQVRQSDKEA